LSEPRDAATLDAVRKRAPRVVAALAVVVAGLAAFLVALEKEALAEQIAIWRVRLTGGVVILPAPGPKKGSWDVEAGAIPVMAILSAIADSAGRPVIVSAAERKLLENEITIAAGMEDMDTKILIQILRANGMEVSRGESVDSLYCLKPCVGLRDEPSEGTLLWVGE
jgi:hypothetical protein